jgi:hypothetical protein
MPIPASSLSFCSIGETLLVFLNAPESQSLTPFFAESKDVCGLKIDMPAAAQRNNDACIGLRANE